MVEAMRAVAAALRQPPEDRITGHSLRTTGAQRMAAAGISEEKIRMFGRWAFNEMVGYAREALLAAANLGTAGTV